ncbi:MAG: response regulator, partial [Lachnospiraceae bacterium]|nr:response regulator [Lachnospiraceae bacterium]
MKIAIVDDDLVYSSYLKAILTKLGKKFFVRLNLDVYSSGNEFLKSDKKYNIVMMDIMMPEKDGIETALEMRQTNPEAILIFQTTSDTHYKDALKCHAYDYINKPYSEEEIEKLFVDIFRTLPVDSHYVVINSQGIELSVMIKGIICVISDKHYLDFHVSNHPVIRSRMTISDFIAAANEDKRFLPINRGVLIN